MTDAEPTALAPAALAGLAVLDLCDSVAGNFCARLFADQGASVVLAEPPGGARLRQLGPFGPPGPDGHPGESYLFHHVNTGKQVLRLPPGPDLTDLAAQADVVVTDEATGLSWLPGPAARPVICQITPFGASDEWAGHPAGELIYQAISGTMYENGRPGQPPLYGVGHRASYAAGVVGYLQAVAVLLSGSPASHVADVSIAEVAASLAFNRITQYSYNGSVLGRDARETQRTIVRTADGWLGAFVDDRRWASTCRSLGLDDLIGDPRWSTLAARADHWADFERELEARTRTRSADELVAAGQQAKAVISRSVRLTELWDFPQLRTRQWWPPRTDGEPPRLGPMFRFSRTPQQHRPGPAVAAAASAGAVRAGWRRRHEVAPRAAARPSRTAGEPGRPLDGVRIIDLTSAWAGPMATRVLAALGADVIKVEGPARLDDWRGSPAGGPPDRYPGFDPGDRPYDRHFQFNTQNHDKRSLVLDLKRGEGRAVALRLIGGADVVMANFSVGTLDRMGLGWAEVSRVAPAAILVEMPAYGQGGPISSYVAYGPSMELMCGMAGTIGYGDGKPVTTGPAYLDPMGGLHGAAAVVTALVARERDGTGQHVEVAQTEAAMHWIGELIIAATVSGRDPEPDGNRIPAAAPHDAYPCRGHDEWIALAAYDDDQFRRLTAALDLGAPAAGPRFASRPARQAHAAELDVLITARTRAWDKEALAARLRAAGVPASAVLNARDLHASEFLRRRGLVADVQHPAAGRHRQQGLPLHISGFDLTIRRAAPRFGEHNREILAALGLVAGEIGSLREHEVITDTPAAARAAGSREGRP